ncbi:MAG: hypothetical protein WBD48_00555 [Pseudolabrys sp.]
MPFTSQRAASRLLYLPLAQRMPSRKYTAPKTGFLAINSLAFASDGDAGYLNSPTGGVTSNPVGCFSTGVNLPEGAKVTRLELWGTSTAGVFPVINFDRENHKTGTLEVISTGHLTDTSGAYKPFLITLTSTKTTIDNRDYRYGLSGCVDQTSTVRGARITYTYTNAGD